MRRLQRAGDDRQLLERDPVPAQVGDHLDRHSGTTGARRRRRANGRDVVRPAQRVHQPVGGERSRRGRVLRPPRVEHDDAGRLVDPSAETASA